MKNFVLDRKPAFSSKAGIIFVILLMAGCSSSSSPELWAEGKPKHHTLNGFRNYLEKVVFYQAGRDKGKPGNRFYLNGPIQVAMWKR